MRNLFCSLLLVTLAYSQTRPASAGKQLFYIYINYIYILFHFSLCDFDSFILNTYMAEIQKILVRSKNTGHPCLP